MTDADRRTVLVFAKPPLAGVAKTRLAAGLGRAEAARIARFTMARTLAAARDTRWRTRLYAAPDRRLSAGLGGLWPAELERRSQGVGDLGDRLTKGLFEAPRGAVLLIGADAPDISRGLIWRAFKALRTGDAVFGPAQDGGFWLFGLNKGLRMRAPFTAVRWSGPHAMADVRANLSDEARVAVLPTLIDIDEAADWRAWRSEVARNSQA
ncbi:MAG: TIGR04282 family arsenosugar biosynthesis glycosyltransferase [Pseudomonadota bacterium]